MATLPSVSLRCLLLACLAFASSAFAADPVAAPSPPAASVGEGELSPEINLAEGNGAFSTARTTLENYLDLFTPFTTDDAALSPDGRRIAYTRRIGEDVWITIVDADNPGKVITEFIAITDTAATPILEIQAKERIPGRVEWMGWVTSDRLVIQTNQVHAGTVDGEFVNYSGFVFGINADGSEISTLVTPTDVARAGEFGTVGPAASNQGPSDASYTFGAEATLEREDPPVADTSGAFFGTDPAELERAAATAPMKPLTIHPRSPTIVDYSPENPDEIWVRAGTEYDFDLYAVNVFTGRKRILATERVLPGRTVLLDRRQKARITLPSTTATEFPHDYLYNTGKLLFPWEELQSLVDDPAQVRFSLGPGNVMGGRSFPIGFDEDPDLLYFASDVGRETFGIYSLQLSTGMLTDLAIEHPRFDLAPPSFHGFDGRDRLIFDRYSREFLGIRYNEIYRSAAWIRPNWQALQDRLETTFPHSSVDLLEWDEARQRFLVRVQSSVDPGGFYLFDPGSGKMTEFARAAPILDSRKDAWTASFTFETPDGRTTAGRLTVPTNPIATPIPMIILCPDNFWDRLPVDYDREAVALARMGYVVAQFNGRGAWGFGREARTAIERGYETTQAAELVAMVDFLKERFAIDPTKVALMGEGLGGFLALRTLQEFPGSFRGAIAINAPFNLREWIQESRWNARERPEGAQDVELIVPYLGNEEHLRSAPLVDSPESILRPVQLFAFRKEDGTELTPDYNHVYTLARTLRSQDIPVELVNLHRDYLRGLPRAHADVFAKIAEFLNTHLFEYEVRLGELEFDMSGE